MPAQKKTIVNLTVTEHAKGNESCLMMEMKFGKEDQTPVDDHARNVGRAVQTFELYADVNNKNIFFAETSLFGPYAIDFDDRKGFMTFLLFAPNNESDQSAFWARVRVGVNSMAGLLRQSGYRVRVRIRPIKQLDLPETAGNGAAVVVEKAEPTVNGAGLQN